MLAVLLLLYLSLLVVLTRPAYAQSVSALTVPLLLPTSIAFDASGSLYVAETNYQVIRRVDAGGVLTTVAGSGTQGFSGDGGLATAAQLDSPSGIVLDTAKNLYIADTHNQRIRRVDAGTGIITTVAGSGAAGFSGDGGPASQASLNLPSALAVDTGGNLYIADTNNHRIRKVDAASGRIVTVAGDGLQQFSGDGGLALTASIDSPSGLAVDAAGNLYFADTHNHRIRTVNAATGLISTLAGTGSAGFTGDNGLGASGTLALPRGLSVDNAGNVYVADSNNQRIRRITPQGIITTVAGDGTQAMAGDGGSAVTASLDTPRATTFSPTGLVTAADTGNGRVRQIAAEATITTIGGLGVAAAGPPLTLTGPATVSYGTGVLTAALATGMPAATSQSTGGRLTSGSGIDSSATGGSATGGWATGQITFLDSTISGIKTLGSATLVGNIARLSIAALQVGAHHIFCIYGGDRTHAPSQSMTALLTIAAAQLTASANSVSIFYGQPIPVFGGSLNGVVPQDQGLVALVLSSGAAAMLSPPGMYTITATLSGPRAENYVLGPLAGASFIINKAPSVATLLATSLSMAPGQPVSLGLHVASTTSGTPTGSVTLLDGVTTLAELSLSPGATISYSTSGFNPGSHTLRAVYAGDADFLASTTAAQTLVVAPAISGDFALAATGSTSQTVLAGSAVSFSFAVQAQGAALASPITLAASALPLGMSANFSPAYLPPGGAVTAFTLTIQTSKTAIAKVDRLLPKEAVMAFGILLLPLLPLGFRRRWRPIASAVCVACLGMLSGCGARTLATANSAAAVASYPITVSGTATSPTGTVLLHTATVTLIIQ